VDELGSLRTSVGKVAWENNPLDMDRRFARAFKRYGLDLTATPIKDAVARLKLRPEAFVREVSGRPDHWLIIRHELSNSSEQEQKLLDIRKILDLGQDLDPSPERNRLRALLMQTDLKSHRQNLATMARQTELVVFGPSSALLLSRLLNSAGDAKNAIAVLRAAVVRFPGDPWTNYELATFLSNTEPPQADESIRFYTAARSLRPETGWDLAEVLHKQGRDDESEALLSELARIDPEPTRNLLQLSTVLRRRGKVDEARIVVDRMIAPYRERAKREPDNSPAHRRIAILLLLSHDLSGAATAYRQAARVNPNDAACRRELGAVLHRMGDLPAAIAAFRDANRIDPMCVSDHYALAAAMEQSGDRIGVIAELREAIRIERLPPNPQIEVALAIREVTLFMTVTSIRLRRAILKVRHHYCPSRKKDTRPSEMPLPNRAIYPGRLNHSRKRSGLVKALI
jgi:eukaryotic-like serine/threonine-protein kinase